MSDQALKLGPPDGEGHPSAEAFSAGEFYTLEEVAGKLVGRRRPTFVSTNPCATAQTLSRASSVTKIVGIPSTTQA